MPLNMSESLQSSDSLDNLPMDDFSEVSALTNTPVIDSEAPVSQQQDPITGLDASTSDYTNTSNGNQVAVLSTIDYSTNLHVYNYTIYNNSTTTNTTVAPPSNTTNDDSTTTNTTVAPPSNTTNDESRNPENTSNSTGTGSNSGSTSLQRSGLHIRFTSRQYFARKGARRVDRIYGFNPSNGDMLELSRSSFKGIRDMNIAIAESKDQKKELSRSDAEIIYHEPSGKMFFNANGEDRGFGRRGGLFAILEDAPIIGSDQLMLI
jgi:hypothetical protein